MKTVTTHEAKTHLSRLLREVEAGETIIIARGKTQIARLEPLGDAQRPKTGKDAYGAWAHLGPFTDEENAILCAPLDDETVRQMEDGPLFPADEEA
jgi:antitoxin (DNA-binding transcriptional repressor) of toxin-antitoxin stability system